MTFVFFHDTLTLYHTTANLALLFYKISGFFSRTLAKSAYSPKILFARAKPVLVVAKPPSEVSLREAGIALPMRFIASITSSTGITDWTPARAISAATIA